MSQRLIDLLVDFRQLQKAQRSLTQQGREGIRDLYMELNEALGTLEPSAEQALARLLWVIENADADPALVQNNIGKGLAALGSSKTPMFF